MKFTQFHFEKYNDQFIILQLFLVIKNYLCLYYYYFIRYNFIIIKFFFLFSYTPILFIKPLKLDNLNYYTLSFKILNILNLFVKADLNLNFHYLLNYEYFECRPKPFRPQFLHFSIFHTSVFPKNSISFINSFNFLPTS